MSHVMATTGQVVVPDLQRGVDGGWSDGSRGRMDLHRQSQIPEPINDKAKLARSRMPIANLPTYL